MPSTAYSPATSPLLLSPLFASRLAPWSKRATNYEVYKNNNHHRLNKPKAYLQNRKCLSRIFSVVLVFWSTMCFCRCTWSRQASKTLKKKKTTKELHFRLCRSLNTPLNQQSRMTTTWALLNVQFYFLGYETKHSKHFKSNIKGIILQTGSRSWTRDERSSYKSERVSNSGSASAHVGSSFVTVITITRQR